MAKESEEGEKMKREDDFKVILLFSGLLIILSLSVIIAFVLGLLIKTW
jgi:hypothetical protein